MKTIEMKAVLGSASIGFVLMIMSIFCILFGRRIEVLLIVGIVTFIIGAIPVVYCMLRLWNIHKEVNLGKVRGVALHVVDINSHYYSHELIDLVPSELSGVNLTDENLHEIGIKIDEIRFQKEAEFACMVDLPYEGATEEQKRKLSVMLNSDIGALSDEEEAKRREIRFLSNLAQTVIHQ